jgi:hypothetical protein
MLLLLLLAFGVSAVSASPSCHNSFQQLSTPTTAIGSIGMCHSHVVEHGYDAVCCGGERIATYERVLRQFSLYETNTHCATASREYLCHYACTPDLPIDDHNTDMVRDVVPIIASDIVNMLMTTCMGTAWCGMNRATDNCIHLHRGALHNSSSGYILSSFLSRRELFALAVLGSAVKFETDEHRVVFPKRIIPALADASTDTDEDYDIATPVLL